MPELISNNHFNLPKTPKIKSLSTVIANPIESDRQIILFPNGFNSRNLAQFKQTFSIRNVAHICDFRDSSWSTSKTEGAQLLVFDRLGVGLLSIDDPQQFRTLKNHTQKNHALRIVRPELQMQLAVSPDSESPPCDEWNASLENFPPNQTPLTSTQRAVTNSRLLKGYEDNQKHSWAMQACGITQIRWTGKGVKIAILDTGLDFNHMDWCSRQITHRSFIPLTIFTDMEPSAQALRLAFQTIHMSPDSAPHRWPTCISQKFSTQMAAALIQPFWLELTGLLGKAVNFCHFPLEFKCPTPSLIPSTNTSPAAA